MASGVYNSYLKIVVISTNVDYGSGLVGIEKFFLILLYIGEQS